MEIATSSAPSTSRRSVVAVLVSATLLMAGAFMFVRHSDESLSDTVANIMRRGGRRACTNANLIITSASTSYNLRTCQNSGCTPGMQDPSSVTATNQLPTWTVNQANGVYTISGTGGGLLTVASSSPYGVTQEVYYPAVSYTSYSTWIITSVNSNSSCDGRYYIKNAANNRYLSSSFTFTGADVTSESHSASYDEEWYIRTVNSQTLCGAGQQSCTTVTGNSYCKTGLQYPWPVCNNMANASSSASRTACNTYCTSCNAWDLSCRVCGGRIDESGNPNGPNYETVNGVPNVPTYTRQCDCNSVGKAAGFSVLAAVVILAAMGKTEN